MGVLQEFIDLRPPGGFDFIMADPPWTFQNRSEAGEGKNPNQHYDCMPLDDILRLPVQVLAAKDCVLWLWAVNPMLPEALMTLSAWGFSFKTAGTWVKRTKHGKDHFGPGYIFRGSNEPILIGTRGDPAFPAKNIRSTVSSYEDVTVTPGDGWPNTIVTIEAAARQHSQKPEAAYAAAELMAPDARRLELFSRTDRAGWRAWGKETGVLNQPHLFEGAP
jgi:N6-adenosine-specific RNA methylase IME4